jgi:hypothetical protein
MSEFVTNQQVWDPTRLLIQSLRLTVVKNFTMNHMKPFTITSNFSLKELVAVVAVKMDVYAGHLELQYHLVSNDKLSTSAMDITMEAELKILIKKLQLLSVPQVLPSGRKSSKTLIPPMVKFEKAGSEFEEEQKGTGSGQKVRMLSFINPETESVVKVVGKAAKPNEGASKPFGSLEDELKTQNQDMLQEKFLCEHHMMKNGRETYCYPNPNKPEMHHILAVQDFGLWATRTVSTCFKYHIF